MKIKRYLDKDMRHVLRRVREDQGPDAVILSNRRVDEGIEVIAAIDYDQALIRHALGVDPEAETKISSDQLAAIAETDVAERPEPPRPQPEIVKADLVVETTRDDVALREMQSELSSLRGLLETQLSGLVWKETARRSPTRAQVLRNLARIGIAPDIANIVVDRLEPIDDVRSLWHAPLATLAQLIEVGDSKLKVMRNCGDPMYRDIVSGALDSRVEEWIYQRSSRDFPYVLTIRGHKVIRIERLEE